jgi:hypothetical protein
MQCDIEGGAGGHRASRQLTKSPAISIVYEFAVLFGMERQYHLKPRYFRKLAQTSVRRSVLAMLVAF